MRATEFITESADLYKQAARLIEENCGPFLRQIKNLKKDILLRGILGGDSEKLMSKGACPVGRKPLDTPIALHLAADDWFLKNTGIRYRSNAVFCTGDTFVASGYGDLYAIFPIGEFSFCYSLLIGDLTHSLEDVLHDVETEQGQKELDQILKRGKYKLNTNLRKAIASENEIMIHCNQYYAVTIDAFAGNDAYLEIAKHINKGMLL